MRQSPEPFAQGVAPHFSGRNPR